MTKLNALKDHFADDTNKAAGISSAGQLDPGGRLPDLPPVDPEARKIFDSIWEKSRQRDPLNGFYVQSTLFEEEAASDAARR